ncbi:MAG: SBBP repeat-containing protein [Bacteroidia bacterium]|nr:SBBP repeat-containing protein [Bacteroidia bacterium]
MKQYLIITTILLCAISVFSQAPKTSWASQSTGGNNNVSTGLVVDKDGNTYITGYFSDTVHFGSYELVCKGMSDVFVAKVDKDGNYLWAISAGGSRQDIPNDIAVDDTGNLYIIGSYALIANFGTESLISSNFSNIF